MVSEFTGEIYRDMREQEKHRKIDPDYMDKLQNSDEVKDTSRAFLIEWLIDVHRKFRLVSETLYVTIFIIDQYLSIESVKKADLHLIGVTALLIATKYEEIYPPRLKELIQVSENKFTKEEILKLEQKILQTLQFEFNTPSAYRFLERFSQLSSVVGNDGQIFFFAQYILEISLMDFSL